MRHGKREGTLFDEKGRLICFDSSVDNECLSCLLIRKMDLVEFLKKNNLNIFWTVLGEKQIVGGLPNADKNFKYVEISGAYWLENNKISGQLKII